MTSCQKQRIFQAFAGVHRSVRYIYTMTVLYLYCTLKRMTVTFCMYFPCQWTAARSTIKSVQGCLHTVTEFFLMSQRFVTDQKNQHKVLKWIHAVKSDDEDGPSCCWRDMMFSLINKWIVPGTTAWSFWTTGIRSWWRKQSWLFSHISTNLLLL